LNGCVCGRESTQCITFEIETKTQYFCTHHERVNIAGSMIVALRTTFDDQLPLVILGFPIDPKIHHLHLRHKIKQQSTHIDCIPQSLQRRMPLLNAS
jgi:hypothetical protein